MLNIMFFFRMHQPYRIKKLSIFDIGNIDSIFDFDLGKSIINDICNLSYKPALQLFLKLIDKLEGKFKISISFSGVLFEQLKAYNPEILELINKLIQTKCVEIVCQPYYNSLSFYYDENEFIYEVNKHLNLIYNSFNYIPKTFMNTELIYSNKLADMLRGFISIKNILTEPVERITGFKAPIYIYKAYGKNPQMILLRHQKLSDDISFNFNNKSWKEYPLNAIKYAKWINDIIFYDKKNKDIYCNLLYDLTTFGYYNQENTGIFEFLYDLPSVILKKGKYNCKFILPSEISLENETKYQIYSTREYISMAGNEKNLNPFIGNDLQKNFQTSLSELLNEAKKQNLETILDIIRNLSSVDFYYYLTENNNSFYPSIESAYQNLLYSLAHIEEIIG